MRKWHRRVYWTLVVSQRSNMRLGAASFRVKRESNPLMNGTTSISIAVWISAVCLCQAATIPAGTALIARTTQPISSHERVGAPFKAELAEDVVVNGKVLLRARTPLTGVVETSLRTPPSSGALRVNLKAILVNGRSVPVQIAGAARLDRFKTKRGVSVSGREWSFPYHTRMAFHLAQPVAL